MALLYNPSGQNVIEFQPEGSKYGLLIPNRLFVGGLGDDVAELDLRNYFMNFGAVKYCKVLLDAEGNSKGFGFVTFVKSEDVDKLLKKADDSLVIKNRKINIGPAVRKQTLKPQMNQSQMMGAQGNIMVANGMPYFIQGPPSHPSIIDQAPPINQANFSSYSQMGMMCAGAGKQPPMQVMFLPDQSLHHPHQQVPLRPSQQQQHPQQLLSPAFFNPGQQQPHKQQQILVPSMAPGMVQGPLGMDQCMYQLPYIMQQQQQHLRQQPQQQQMLNEAYSLDLMQQQHQQQQFVQNLQREQQFILANNKGLGTPMQYVDFADLSLSSNIKHPPCHINATTASFLNQHPVVYNNSNHSLTNIDSRRAIKRSLAVIRNDPPQSATFSDVYGVPPVKVLAGEGQVRIASGGKEGDDEKIDMSS